MPRVGDIEPLYSTSAALGGQLTWAFGQSSAGGSVGGLALLNG